MFNTNDDMQTTGMKSLYIRKIRADGFAAGSFALEGVRLGYEATVVRKLREAGAIILETTNMSQWANFRSSPAPNGWSARGGQCYRVYHDRQDPTGSSSGSAVAARLGLATACLGTEVIAVQSPESVPKKPIFSE